MRHALLIAAATLAFATLTYAEAPFSSALVNSAGATVSAGFGTRTNAEGANVFHAGADIEAAAGTAVHAPADGRVLRVHPVGALNGYNGQVVDIDHGDRVLTRISGLEGADSLAGAQVNAGDVIGRIAAREDGGAAHVHVEVWRDGRVFDPATQVVLTPPT